MQRKTVRHIQIRPIVTPAQRVELVALAVAIALATGLGCAGKKESTAPKNGSGDRESADTKTDDAAKSETPAEAEKRKPSAPKSEQEQAAGNPQVDLETSMGPIRLELFPDKAPITVDNFLRYVDDGFYAGTIFHRVISDFMIQGGGFTADMKQKPTRDPIKNEAANGLTHQRGTIAMARTGVVDSATAQFFINVKDNPPLNHRDSSPQGFGYCVFGRVIEGMDTVDKIRDVRTESVGPYGDVPVEAVVIKSASRVESQ